MDFLDGFNFMFDKLLSFKILKELVLIEGPKKSSRNSMKIRIDADWMYTIKSHNKKVHLDILSLYNQSVAEAENDSEELALAIHDRLALLTHLKMYEESLDDIEKSYKITKSDELKTKLLKYKAECLSFIDKSDKTKESNTDTQESDEVPVIQKVSETIPCAADCITLTYDKKYGRCIIATEDIKPGTIIVQEKGVVLLPYINKTFKNCSHCLTLACKGVPCNSCAAVIYCSEKCRDEAWSEYHDIECLILSQLVEYVEKIDKGIKNLIFTLRLFFKLIKNEGLENIMHKVQEIRTNNDKDGFIKGFFENGLFQSNKFQSFYNFKQWITKKEDYLYFATMIRKILTFLAEKTDILKDYNNILDNDDKSPFEYVIEVLYELNLILELSSYTYTESCSDCKEPELCKSNCGDKRIGEFIAPFCILFNHSCNENTHTIFTKNQEMLIIAKEFINKGDQIFLNYGTHWWHLPKLSRQDILMEGHNFICECIACKNDFPPDFDILWEDSIVANLTDKFKEANINLISLTIFHGALHNAPFDKTTIKDVIKMCQIIQKNYDSTVAFPYLVNIKNYIALYFDKLYNVKSFNISGSC